MNRPRRTKAAENHVLMLRHRMDFRVNGCILIAATSGATHLSVKITANDGPEAFVPRIEYVRRERLSDAA
jgi:hypothetical protein